ncbi:MAG: OmpA family protein, partial [Aliifodinibius sp.]|nr:OmpA family protein [Fodinibius sp.]NIV15946.1 OmpA family protein [Fodinibius sp.]NIY29884.1 OmpA family protein [Fodinibius sp.]
DEFINIQSDSVTGYYETRLPIGFKYAFYARAENYISINENVSTENVKHNSIIEQDLYLVPIEVGGTIRLNNIFFDFNKATLKEESFPELNRLIKLFDQIPGLEIELGGHTDAVGSDAYNQNLSEQRANAVRDYLLENGINPDVVVAKGYGETV